MVGYFKRFFGGNSSAPAIYGEKKEENSIIQKVSSLDKRVLFFIFAFVFSILAILLVLIIFGGKGGEVGEPEVADYTDSGIYDYSQQTPDYSPEQTPDFGEQYYDSSTQGVCDPYLDPFCESSPNYSYWEDPGYYSYEEYPVSEDLSDCPAGKCCDGTTYKSQSCSSGSVCCAGSNPIGDCKTSCTSVFPDCPAGKCCDGTTNKIQQCTRGLSCCLVSGSGVGECKSDCLIVSGNSVGLAAHYSFEDNLNDSVKNVEGVYRDYLSNSIVPAKFGSGVSGKAVEFNGSGTVQVPDTNPVSGYKNFSISVWFYLNNSLPVSKYLVAKFSARYYIMASNHTVFSSLVPSSYPAEPRLNTISRNYSYGAWHNLVMVREGVHLRQYYDGVLVSSNSSVSEGILSGATGILQFGGYIFPTCLNAKTCAGFFEGKIDEVKIWNYALSPQEVLAEYNSLKPSAGISGGVIKFSGHVVRTLRSLF